MSEENGEGIASIEELAQKKYKDCLLAINNGNLRDAYGYLREAYKLGHKTAEEVFSTFEEYWTLLGKKDFTKAQAVLQQGSKDQNAVLLAVKYFLQVNRIAVKKLQERLQPENADQLKQLFQYLRVLDGLGDLDAKLAVASAIIRGAGVSQNIVRGYKMIAQLVTANDEQSKVKISEWLDQFLSEHAKDSNETFGHGALKRCDSELAFVIEELANWHIVARSQVQETPLEQFTKEVLKMSLG